MKIKAFLSSGRFKILKAFVISDVEKIDKIYPRWEYIL